MPACFPRRKLAISVVDALSDVRLRLDVKRKLGSRHSFGGVSVEAANVIRGSGMGACPGWIENKTLSNSHTILRGFC